MQYDEFAERKKLDLETVEQYSFLLCEIEDADIVLKMKHVKSRTEYIKKLIREDIERLRAQEEKEAEKARRKER